jgi:transcriptional regulator with XRE-family HTH domain
LAEESDLARPTVTEIETGKTQRFDAMTLAKLARKLDVPIAELWRDHEWSPAGYSIEAFLSSPWAITLEPALSESEVDWLREASSAIWLGGPPTHKSLHFLILARRACVVDDVSQR